jgi:hypothetical protein
MMRLFAPGAAPQYLRGGRDLHRVAHVKLITYYFYFARHVAQ